MSTFPFTRRVATTSTAPASVSHTSAFVRRRRGRRTPRLAEGVELVGQFEDSGLKDPPYIVRRGDGQVVQLPHVLYALAEELDGKRGYKEIAQRMSHRIQRGVSAQAAEMLVKQKLVPLGVVAPADGRSPRLAKVDPLTALKFRTKLVPGSWVTALTTLFRPLFLPQILVPMIGAFIAADVWLFGFHGISQGLRRTLYDPALLLMLLVGVITATAFHEVGHATGTRYGGARPGVMGVGIYIVWPAFYTDITDAYRLNKRGRLRADLGGIYFNAVFAVCVALGYLATRFEPLLLLIVLQNFTIFQQSLPLLRLDGYYIVSDLTGVPDILMRIRPVLRSLLPGREMDPRVRELKPWARRVVTGYVALVVPLIALVFLMMLIHAPRVMATAYDSVGRHYHQFRLALGAHRGGMAAMDGFQMAVLLLPSLGMVYTSGRVLRRATSGVRRWSGGNHRRQAAAVLAAAGAAVLLAAAWLPRSEFRSIQANDRGTLVEGLARLFRLPPPARLAGGSPSSAAGASGVPPVPGQSLQAPARTTTTTSTSRSAGSGPAGAVPTPATSTPSATQTTAGSSSGSAAASGGSTPGGGTSSGGATTGSPTTTDTPTSTGTTTTTAATATTATTATTTVSPTATSSSGGSTSSSSPATSSSAGSTSSGLLTTSTMPSQTTATP